MTREEAINWIRLDIEMAKIDPTTGEKAYLNDDAKHVIEAQELAIQALQQLEPCEDTVSRAKLQEKLQWIIDYGVPSLDGKHNLSAEYVLAYVNKMPSVQPETHDKRTETHSCDLISRRAAINVANVTDYTGLPVEDVKKVTDEVVKGLKMIPSAQSKKEYTKADYIMALHKEYGCDLKRAEKAHDKALEYLRDTAMLKG